MGVQGTVMKLLVIGAILLGLLLYGCSSGNSEPMTATSAVTTTAVLTTTEATTTTAEATTTTTTQPILGTLGITPDQFVDQWNTAAESYPSTLRMRNVRIEEGAVQDVFEFTFTDKLSVTGYVNKADGTIRSVRYEFRFTSVKNDPTADSKNLEGMTGAAVFVAAVDPALGNAVATALVFVDLWEPSPTFVNLDKTIQRNGIEYHMVELDYPPMMQLAAKDVNDTSWLP